MHKYSYELSASYRREPNTSQHYIPQSKPIKQHIPSSYIPNENYRNDAKLSLSSTVVLKDRPNSSFALGQYTKVAEKRKILYQPSKTIATL